MSKRLYKVLSADGRSCHGGRARWHLPKLRSDGTYEPGEWMPRVERLEPCISGYHLCRRQDLIYWLEETIYEAECRGERIDVDGCDGKVVVASARLVRPLTTWNETTARLFAADCAESVLPIFEHTCPGDERPRRAIEAARAYARGEIDEGAMRAAGVAAWEAAWAAPGDAAPSAGRAAALTAASLPGLGMTEALGRGRAGAAARSAARAAAYAVIWAEGRAAARDETKAAQTELLFDYLEGRRP